MSDEKDCIELGQGLRLRVVCKLNLFKAKLAAASYESGCIVSSRVSSCEQ